MCSRVSGWSGVVISAVIANIVYYHHSILNENLARTFIVYSQNKSLFISSWVLLNIMLQIRFQENYKPTLQTISILFIELKSILALSFRLLAAFDNLNGIWRNAAKPATAAAETLTMIALVYRLKEEICTTLYSLFLKHECSPTKSKWFLRFYTIDYTYRLYNCA